MAEYQGIYEEIGFILGNRITGFILGFRITGDQLPRLGRWITGTFLGIIT